MNQKIYSMNIRNFLIQPKVMLAALALAGLGLLFSGWVLSHMLHLAACPLCILQRILYMGIGISAVAAIPFVRRCRLFTMGCSLLTALFAATGIVVAGYQVWIQRFTPSISCGAEVHWWEQISDWAGQLLPALFLATGLCADNSFKILGLSIAEGSLIAFILLFILAIFCFVVLRRLALRTKDKK